MSPLKFTRDVGIIALINLILSLRGLIILPIITKFLGPEDYGIWSQIMVTIYLFSPLATFGLPYALIRFLAGEKDKRVIQEGIWSVVSLVFLFTSFLSLISILFSQSLSYLLGGEPILFKILGFIILFESLNLVFLNIFRTFQEIKGYSFFIIFQGAGEIGLIVGTILLGYQLIGAVFSLLLIRLLNFFIMAFLIIKKIGIKIPNFSKLREYLFFGLPTVPANISSWFLHSGDRYLIGHFLGIIFVGYYVPACTLGGIISFLGAPLSFLLPAVLSKFYEEKKFLKVKAYLQYSLKYFLFLALPCVFGLSILAKQLLTLFSTPEIAQQGYLVLPLVALSMLLYGLYGILSQVLSLVKKTFIIAKIWLGAAFLNFTLNLIFIPRLGILGAALSTFLSYSFTFFLVSYYSWKYFPLEIDWSFIKKSIFSSILISGFIVWFHPQELWEILIAIPAYALFYFLLIFFLKGFEKKEIAFLKKILKFRKRNFLF